MVVNFTQLLARECEGKLGGRSGPVHRLFRGGRPEDRGPAEGPAGLLGGIREGTGRFRLRRLRSGSRQSALEPPGGHRGEWRRGNFRSVAHGGSRGDHADATFQNLISNAIKFRGGETPRIHVSAERDGEEWLFAVRDNGIGIEPRDADRVFGMFKRLHGSEIPVRASDWRSVRRSWSARVDGSGWNRKRGAAPPSSSQFTPPPTPRTRA